MFVDVMHTSNCYWPGTPWYISRYLYAAKEHMDWTLSAIEIKALLSEKQWTSYIQIQVVIKKKKKPF